MIRKIPPLVLDAWPLLAYLLDEPGGVETSDAIVEANSKGRPLLMNVVNACEVWYSIAREKGETEADRTIEKFGELGIRLVEADWSTSRSAAVFKDRFRLPLGDAFAAALAKREKGTLLTGDPDFRALVGEIDLRWVGPAAAQGT